MATAFIAVISTNAAGKLQLFTVADGAAVWLTQPDILASNAMATTASINAASFNSMFFQKVSAFPVGTNGMVAIMYVTAMSVDPNDVVITLNDAPFPGVLLASEIALEEYVPPPSPEQEAVQFATAICAALQRV